MFRVRSSGTGRSGMDATLDMMSDPFGLWGVPYKINLEAEVGEGAVGLGHLVNVVTLTDGVAGIVGGVLDLVGEGDMHWSALSWHGQN